MREFGDIENCEGLSIQFKEGQKKNKKMESESGEENSM